MIEEIKKDNNCILKAFENNPISIIQEDLNDKKIYYFKASDIGKALNLSNIAVSIQSYDEDEKVVRKAYDLRGCEQDTIFLTSRGVYRLLYSSKKEIAKKFRKWASDILDDIIFNQSIELKRQLEEQQKLIEEQKNLVEEKTEQLKEQQKKLEFYENKPSKLLSSVTSYVIKIPMAPR
jgi:prophage antirepressor-like protein